MSFEVILPFLRPIEHLIRDKEISEIMVNGSGRIFIEKHGEIIPVPDAAIAEKSLQVAVRNIARTLGDEIDEDMPLLDARLPDGSRVPGFYNHKYGHPHLVTVESRSERISRPEQFPRFASESRDDEASARRSNSPPGRITQSERDWAYVRSALREGAVPQALMEELKVRRSDKFNPDDYARRTVEKAVDSVKQDDFVGPDR